MSRLVRGRIGVLESVALKSSSGRKGMVMITRFGFLYIILMSISLCLLASVSWAQTLFTPNFPAYPAQNGDGWWSPDRPGWTAPNRNFQITITDRTFVPNTKSLPEVSDIANYRSISPAVNPFTYQSNVEVKFDAEGIDRSSVAKPELLLPESFFSVLQSEYTSWESRLEDSESPTNVNGHLFYPLVQINSGDWHLPINLYIAPLRGSDGGW
jgi:hypothetical protein